MFDPRLASPSAPAPAPSGSPRSQSTNLIDWPEDACGQVGVSETMKHVSELFPTTGLVVLVAAHDLIEDVNGIRAVTAKVGSKTVFALTSIPDHRGEMFRHGITWATTIGHAGTVLFCGHELSVLLGVDAGRGEMRNGIVIVKDGKMVWSKVADARRPKTPHEIEAFQEAFDYHSR